MNLFYLGYDNIFYQLGLHSDIHAKPIKVWPINHQQTPNQSDWANNFLKLEAHGNDIVFVIPNSQYEDKRFFYSFYKYLKSVYSGYNINIFAETTALATYLSGMNYDDGKYRVINLGQSSVQVHDIEIHQNQYYHLNSEALQWSIPKSLHKYFEEKEDSFFTNKDITEQKKMLNKIYHEDFKSLSSKYYCYRVDYESTFTYANIHEIINDWKEDYHRIMNFTTSVTPDVHTLYCGELLDLDFFADSINIKDHNKIDLKNTLKSLYKTKKIQVHLDSDIKLTLHGLNYGLFSLLKKEEVVNFNNYFDKDKGLIIRKTRIPVPSDKVFIYPLSFIYNDTQYEGYVNIEWPELSKRVVQSGNVYHRWIEVDLNLEIDSCDNLVLNIFQNSVLVHTESIAKLKNYGSKRIIS